MPEQKSPHTQSQENENPARPDLEPGQLEQESGTGSGSEIYDNMDGAETGGTRSSKKVPISEVHHDVEPPTAAYEGSTHTRTPEGGGQGITSHSTQEESERQRKVVKNRPDARAGLNHAEPDERSA